MASRDPFANPPQPQQRYYDNESDVSVDMRKDAPLSDQAQPGHNGQRYYDQQQPYDPYGPGKSVIALFSPLVSQAFHRTR